MSSQGEAEAISSYLSQTSEVFLITTFVFIGFITPKLAMEVLNGFSK